MMVQLPIIESGAPREDPRALSHSRVAGPARVDRRKHPASPGDHGLRLRNFPIIKRHRSRLPPFGDFLFEPFTGSGTQIIAAEKTATNCYGMELDPAYCDVAVRRWQEFTGQTATLEGDGRTFAEIEAERAVTKAA